MKKTILIVDDEPDLLEIMQTWVEGMGYKVLVATDGAQAVQMLEHHSPDFIFLDILMPGMDGFQLLEKIKSSRGLMDIPVVMLTAKGDPLSRHEVNRLGANDFLQKPVAEKQLEEMIRKYLA